MPKNDLEYFPVIMEVLVSAIYCLCIKKKLGFRFLKIKIGHNFTREFMYQIDDQSDLGFKKALVITLTDSSIKDSPRSI